MRRIVGVLILVAAAVMLLGRQHGPDTTSGAQPAPAGSSTLVTGSATTTPVQTPSSSTTGSVAAPEPGYPQQTGGFTAYARAAEAFMADFARPAGPVTDQQWWGRVGPHLTAAAAAAYEGTDPQNVPFTKVTGPANVLLTEAPTDPQTEAPNDLVLFARVPTDAGWYRVEMVTVAEGIRISRAIPEAGTS